MGLITQIQLGTLGYLDINEDVLVPLNFSVAEIQDISKRQGGYSKTIKLPGTPNNNNLFGTYYDVNISDSTFNVAKREKCIILQNGVPIFNGYLQLLNVVKLNKALENLDEFITYEVQVKDDTGDFYSNLGERYLEDLTGFDRYDHKYISSNLLASWYHTVLDGYKYPMMYNQKTEYNLTDFLPAIYAKTYLDSIFTQNGYTYTWDSLTDNNFDKLLIPYNGDKPLADLEVLKVRAAFNAQRENISVDPTFDEFDIVFNDDSTSPNIDLGNHYNTVNGKYTSDFIGTAEFRAAYYYRIDVYCPVDCYLQGTYTEDTITPLYTIEASSIRILLQHIMKKNGVELIISGPDFYDYIIDSTPAFSDTVPFSLTPYRTPFSAGYNYVISGASPEFFTTLSLLPGDIMNNAMSTFFDVLGTWYDSSTNLPLSDANKPRISIRTGLNVTNYSNNYFIASPTADFGINMEVKMTNFIPKKIRQKDFISGLVKMFNLYITNDPNNDKNLIIETRDEFYDNGGTLDWTDKFVSDQDSKIEFLPDLQSKKLTLTYKKDTDIFNTNYFNNINEIYGQVQIEFNSDFVKDTKTIETIFSPTPLATNYFGNIVPTIVSDAPKNNIRILYDGGLISADLTEWTYRETTVSPYASFWTVYPYAGHFDNPLIPTVDINYELSDYLFYAGINNSTNNNLYNKYWSRYINQINTGKLLTAKFRLNEYDIMNLNFRDKIFIHDTYWFLNKITDYDSNSKEGLTTVELINVDEGLKFSPFNITSTSISFPYINPGTRSNRLHNDDSLSHMTSRNTFNGSSSGIQLLGQDNIIQSSSRDSIIAGQNNNVSGVQNLIMGDNNVVIGDNIIGLGLNNVTLRNSNTFTFGGPIINYVNFIDAGRNEVINPFSSTKLINFISGGRNEVRPIGGNGIEMIIDSGRNIVV